MTDARDDSLGGADALIDRSGEQVRKTLEQIFAAQPGAVFGQPVESGGYTLITASEVTSGGGFGVGMGRGLAPGQDPGQSPAGEAAVPPAGRRSIGEAALAAAAGPRGDRWRSSPSARAA